MEKLERHDLNCNIFDVYDYDGLSMQELLCQFFTKINECVDFSNSTLDLCSWLVNEGLKQEVAIKLTNWLNDGTLEDVINVTLFENLNKKIDNASLQLSHIENKFNNKFNNFDYVNVKDFGAIGNGIVDDTEAIKQALKTGKNIKFPEGDYLITETLYINDNMYKRSIKGSGNEYVPTSRIICNTYPAIICKAGGVSIENISFKSKNHIIDTSDCFIKAYKEKIDNPDIDLTIRNCGFEGLPYVVKIIGRNILIENCLFYAISKAVLKIDFTGSIDNPLPNDPYVYNNMQSGMRGYILKNNRCHYIRSYLIENTGHNAHNITGVQITDNFMEATLFVNGSLKDSLITGNNAFQVSTSKSMFNCDIIKNVVINGNIIKGEDSFEGLYETSMENIITSPNVENLLFTNNFISNVRANVFLFNGVSNRIIFENNIGRRVSTVSGSYITFIGTQHKDIKINDKVESPNRENWVCINKALNTKVIDYNINTSISGVFERIHGLNPIESSEGITSTTNKVTGFYEGNSAGNITLITKYKPSIFKVTNSDGEAFIFNVKKHTSTFGSGGVTLDGSKFNILGKSYYWESF